MPSPTPFRRVLILSAAGLFAVGCANKNNSSAEQKAKESERSSQQAQTAGDATGRVREIISKVGALQQTTEQLPGSTEADYRSLMQASFGQLLQVFPLLEGEYQSGEFRQGMRILDSTRQQLASGSKDLAVEPTIGQGMRALVRLLVDVNNVVFNNDELLTRKLDELHQRVDELDSVHGPLNRVVSARAVRDATAVLQQMSTSLAERTGVDMKPAASAQ
jgi:hypothetical protein